MFAVMERLTAELFNTYVQRSGDAEPYYTEYCDGRTVTCPGMKQWGTVERAKEGKNAARRQQRDQCTHPAKAAVPHCEGLPLLWQAGGERRL